MESIEIRTSRLILKPLGTRYITTVNEYALNPENTKYMCHLPNADSEETLCFLQNVETEWAKEKPGFFEFAVLYNDRHIGAVSVYFEQDVGELGWIINRKYWKNGFACEAAEALVKYFRQHYGIQHFRAHCDTENTASYRIMEKLGMVRTGVYEGRRNRSASEDSMEYQYDLLFTGQVCHKTTNRG